MLGRKCSRTSYHLPLIKMDKTVCTIQRKELDLACHSFQSYLELRTHEQGKTNVVGIQVMGRSIFTMAIWVTIAMATGQQLIPIRCLVRQRRTLRDWIAIQVKSYRLLSLEQSKLDETNATATMDFTNWNQTLTAHKSWFMLKDKIAFGKQYPEHFNRYCCNYHNWPENWNQVFHIKVYVNDKASPHRTRKDYPETQSVF